MHFSATFRKSLLINVQDCRFNEFQKRNERAHCNIQNTLAHETSAVVHTMDTMLKTDEDGRMANTNLW